MLYTKDSVTTTRSIVYLVHEADIVTITLSPPRESQKIRPKRPKSDPPITFWIGFRLGVHVRISIYNPQPPHISRKNFVSLCINCYPLIRRGELLWLKPNTEKQGVAFYYGLWLNLYRCLVRRLGWRMATSGSRSSVSLVWWWWSSTTASSYR